MQVSASRLGDVSWTTRAGISAKSLFTTAFETIERNRDQLARILRQGGFDTGRDVLAITVNGWPHGYACEYSTLWGSAILDSGDRTLLANLSDEFR